MDKTPFPTKPAEVVALSAQEFTFELDLSDLPAIDDVCNRFCDDANRALVWLLRFRALKALCAQPEMAVWLDGRAQAWRAVCQIAATCELSDAWEFDKDLFCLAVEAIRARETDTARG
jgi:hypothetical protein